MSWIQSVNHILSVEGSFSAHPADPGGATNMGITWRVLSEWRGHQVTVDEIKSLTRGEAVEIYKARYWQEAKCDLLLPGLALMVFDAAVNSGVGRATRTLQQSVGVTADGVIGPKTLAAVHSQDQHNTIIEYAARRMHFYARLETFSAFGLGWSRRLMATLDLALNLEKEE